MRAVVAGLALAVALAPAADAKTYRKGDSGKRVKVAKGETFKVRLKQHTRRGYAWSYETRPDRAVLQRVRKRTVTPCKSAYCVGGDSVIVWTFKAVGRGRTTLALVEERPSGYGDALGRFELTVRVRRR